MNLSRDKITIFEGIQLVSNKLSSLLMLDIQQNYNSIEAANPLDDSSMLLLDRQHMLLDALLPIVLLAETLGIIVVSQDLTSLNAVIAFIAPPAQRPSLRQRDRLSPAGPALCSPA